MSAAERIGAALPAPLQRVAGAVYHPLYRRLNRTRYDGVDIVRASIGDVEVTFDASTRLAKNWLLPRYEDETVHELAVTAELLEALDADSDFWDVGTHIGWFASFAASKLGPEGSVHAFDLDSEALSVAASSLARNSGRTPTTTVHAAVSSTDGETVGYAPFSSSPTPFGGIDRALNRPVGDGEKTLGEAKTLTLDRYAVRAGLPDVLKLDVEGHELAVLRGARDLLEHGPTLLLAIHPPQLRERDQDPADVYDELGRHGYVDFRTLAEDDPLDGEETVKTVVATT